jgi:hypothetical protein
LAGAWAPAFFAMRVLNHTLELMSLLADGPKLGYELPGPWYRVSNRIRDCNTAYAKQGSHWRIRGRWVRVPDSSGRRVRTMLYRMVLE